MTSIGLSGATSPRRGGEDEESTRLTEPEERSLRLHEMIAAKLAARPEPVIALARHNLATQRAADDGGRSSSYLDAWERLLDGPLDVLAATLTSTDQTARDLRQSSPFSGVLSDEERLGVIHEAWRARANGRAGYGTT